MFYYATIPMRSDRTYRLAKFKAFEAGEDGLPLVSPLRRLAYPISGFQPGRKSGLTPPFGPRDHSSSRPTRSTAARRAVVDYERY